MNVNVKVKYGIENDSWHDSPTYLYAYISYRADGMLRPRSIRYRCMSRGGVTMNKFNKAIVDYLTLNKEERKAEIQELVKEDIRDNYIDEYAKKAMKEGLSFSFNFKD